MLKDKLRADLLGQKFNKLTILSYFTIGKRGIGIIAKCDCGKIKNFRRTYEIVQGRVKSCGCLNLETSYFIHKLSYHKLYWRWQSMKFRCYNKTGKFFNNYKKRGTTVCQEWLDDFMNFYNWSIANGWDSNLQLDRIDNDGNYEPSNCRWVTSAVNGRNKSNVIKTEFQGKEYLAIELYEKHKPNISCQTFMNRLKAGWNSEKALFSPANRTKPKKAA